MEIKQPCIHITGLPYDLTEAAVVRFCSKFGKVVGIKMPMTDAYRNRGFAYVIFTDSDCAANAIKALNDGVVWMKTLYANWAVRQKDTRGFRLPDLNGPERRPRREYISEDMPSRNRSGTTYICPVPKNPQNPQGPIYDERREPPSFFYRHNRAPDTQWSHADHQESRYQTQTPFRQNHQPDRFIPPPPRPPFGQNQYSGYNNTPQQQQQSYHQNTPPYPYHPQSQQPSGGYQPSVNRYGC